MESFLIFLLVTVVAGLSNWLQKRMQAPPDSTEHTNRDPSEFPSPLPPGTAPSAPPRPRPPPPPDLATILEREFRKLLGGDPSAPPPAEPAVLPPVVAAPPIAPPPRKAAPARMSPATPGRRGTFTVPQQLSPAGPVPPERFRESTFNHERAQQLQENVASRLREIDERTRRHTGAAAVRSSRPLKPLPTLRGNPAAAREAFIASLIFSPPKATEE